MEEIISTEDRTRRNRFSANIIKLCFHNHRLLLFIAKIMVDINGRRLMLVEIYNTSRKKNVLLRVPLPEKKQKLVLEIFFLGRNLINFFLIFNYITPHKH